MKSFSDTPTSLLDFANLSAGERAELLQNIVSNDSSSVESLQVVMEVALRAGQGGYSDLGIPVVDMLWDIVNHPHVTPEMLDKIARYSHPDVKASVADRVIVLPETLAYLAKSKNIDGLWTVVNNPSIPIESLREIAKRTDKLGLKARQYLFGRHGLTTGDEKIDYGKLLRDLEFLPPQDESPQ